MLLEKPALKKARTFLCTVRRLKDALQAYRGGNRLQSAKYLSQAKEYLHSLCTWDQAQFLSREPILEKYLLYFSPEVNDHRDEDILEVVERCKEIKLNDLLSLSESLSTP